MGYVNDLVEKIDYICKNPMILNSLKLNAIEKGKKYTLNQMINKYHKVFINLLNKVDLISELIFYKK